MTSTTLKHPSLGEIIGTQEEGVKRYLGIKYAEIKHRFDLPKQVKRSSADGALDATKYGPSVPQWPIGIDIEFGLLQQSLDKPPLVTSETEGLNLNVFVPAGSSADNKVLVWLHGGGFLHGSNAWPQWDLTRLVRLSHEQGMPIVGVAINYRLGLPGFLTSSELTSAGIKSNRGIRDQIAALQWVKENISGFGGDPTKISVMGQSMGGAACTYLLHQSTPLFDKLIALGGNSLGLKPLPPFVPDAVVYPAIQNIFGLSNLSPDERIARLKDLPMDEVFGKLPPSLPLIAVSGDDVIPDSLTFSGLSAAFAKDHWCRKILVGDCSLDGSILGDLFLQSKKEGIGGIFAASLRKSFEGKPEIVETILTAYGINKAHSDDEAEFLSVVRFATDIVFHATSSSWAQTWISHGGAYRYYFDEPNPWPGKWHGHSAHIMDAIFLFQTFNEKLDAKQRAIAQKMARDIIAFINDKDIQTDFEKGEVPSIVYGENREREEIDTDPETGRRTILSQLVERNLTSLDELQNAWTAFMQAD